MPSELNGFHLIDTIGSGMNCVEKIAVVAIAIDPNAVQNTRLKIAIFLFLEILEFDIFFTLTCFGNRFCSIANAGGMKMARVRERVTTVLFIMCVPF